MNSITKKILIIGLSVVCALLIVALTLSLITVRPMDMFGKYDRIRVLSGFDTAQAITEENKKALEKAEDTVKFSVMRAVLEGGTGYKIRPHTKKVDGETERVKYTTSSFKSLRPFADQFMLMLSFDTAQTNERFTDEDGKKIIYDTIILVIPKGDNKISDVRVYPYLAFNFDNQLSNSTPDDKGHVGSSYYNVYEFRAKMYTYKMYDALTEHFVAGPNTSTEV